MGPGGITDCGNAQNCVRACPKEIPLTEGISGVGRQMVGYGLRKFLTRGELIGKEGKHLISIPLPGIDLPHFRYGDNKNTGVGQGDGEAGQQVDAEGGSSTGGDEPGQHILEVDVTLDELADILGEELELPRIVPKGKHSITAIRERYSSIRQTGPESLRHFKRTFRRALRRMLMTGIYDPDDPHVVFERRDKQYRSWKTVKQPQSNAVIVYMMDVSGSMGHEQKELVRLEAFWIDAWLRRNYEGIDSRYIVHDVNATEVDRETFFRIREDGGTKISSAFKCAKELLDCRTTPLKGTQVDAIFYCTWSSGFSYFTHNTKVGTVLEHSWGDRGINITRPLIDQGTDALKMIVDFGRANGIEVFFSMRMNDTHDSMIGGYGPYLRPRFKREHPEYLVGSEKKQPPHGTWSSVDYAVPEVRDLAYRFFEEVCRSFDIDGVEMDFFRRSEERRVGKECRSRWSPYH